MGFGLVKEDHSAVIDRLSEEHGHLNIERSERRYRVGEQLSIIPNHVCTTINMHDEIYGVRGDQVETFWRVAGRGQGALMRIAPIGPIGPVLLIITALLIPRFFQLTKVVRSRHPQWRVIDPESRTDAIRNLGISNGTIKAITTTNLGGATVIDARGLVVSPGFIDLHQHDRTKKTIASKRWTE